MSILRFIVIFVVALFAPIVHSTPLIAIPANIADLGAIVLVGCCKEGKTGNVIAHCADTAALNSDNIMEVTRDNFTSDGKGNKICPPEWALVDPKHCMGDGVEANSLSLSKSGLTGGKHGCMAIAGKLSGDGVLTTDWHHVLTMRLKEAKPVKSTKPGKDEKPAKDAKSIKSTKTGEAEEGELTGEGGKGKKAKKAKKKAKKGKPQPPPRGDGDDDDSGTFVSVDDDDAS